MLLGSPPHTRGIFFAVVVLFHCFGFTPAYAGNIVLFSLFIFLDQVHPRIRGEYTGNTPDIPPIPGSPPHTRGILSAFFFCPVQHRFTPAYAGNITRTISDVGLLQVHPRIRGEYSLSRSCALSCSGSPPHTRGIFNYNGDSRTWHRFTPAYAGNIPYCQGEQQSPQVHPRIRGEYPLNGASCNA